MTNTMKLKNKKGFTLTELIVVIVIIGILAAVLIPSLTGYITKANKSAAEQEAKVIADAYEIWYIEKLADDATEEFTTYIANNDMKLLSSGQEIVTGSIKYVSGTSGALSEFSFKASNGYKVEITITNGKCTLGKVAK